MTADSAKLMIALAKGRILNEILPLLAEVGIRPLEEPAVSRKLIFETSRADIRLVLVRATDVPTYVEYGAADLGVTGKDVLLEYDGRDLYEPLDLGIARCRMMVAGLPGVAPPERLRVATKYPNVTRRHFAARGEQVEVIKLYGSMELAPLSGLADKIVDLVESGNTLRANGLIAEEKICDISARLVVNKAAMKIRHRAIRALLRALALRIAERAGG
ncbi:MAG: ATP phosphoribosyltransferase [Gammaproteobacteria bacterium]|nr:ATP phosphoribosyltransferase [Gammaproteobacteria bacterium]